MARSLHQKMAIKIRTRMHFLPWSGILEAKKYKQKGHVSLHISTSYKCIHSCLHLEDWFYVSHFILYHAVFLNLSAKIHNKVYHKISFLTPTPTYYLKSVLLMILIIMSKKIILIHKTYLLKSFTL